MEVADTQLMVVRVDRDRVMQVMLNLLSNAVKFAPAGHGEVRVSAECDGGWLVVHVADNGEGITADDQQIIFDKFRQGGDRRLGKPQGTGLGLPISAQIVAHFGGRLWVESDPGKGATFSFMLPLPVDK
jgi:signal transduction histidine kinase